jgi:hypothetical protein
VRKLDHPIEETPMPANAFTSERGRELALQRHAASTPEQRQANADAANKARGRVKDVAEKVDLIGALSVDMLAELRALRAEIAELRSERVAA